MMNKSRIMMSMFVIALAAALIGGATMAWFSYKVEVENVFTAGTVTITAEEDVEATDDLDNVNPGDCLDKVIDICVTGSKGVVLRMRNTGEWVYTTAWRNYLRDNWDELCYSEVPKPTDQDGWDAIISAMNVLDVADFEIEGWTLIGDWWYSPASIDAGTCIDVTIEVCFDGEDMDNYFQKARFTMNTEIQALQSSNYAPFHEWGVDIYGIPPAE